MPRKISGRSTEGIWIIEVKFKGILIVSTIRLKQLQKIICSCLIYQNFPCECLTY
jgi:hypothetical protein